MPTEPLQLTEARALLAKFEVGMASPESLNDLAGGLSLLSQFKENASGERAQVAENLAVTYAKKAQAAVESLLGRESSIHWETVDHWESVLSEFLRYGFSIPPEIAETRSNLLSRKLTKEIDLMSPEERQQLLEKLEEAMHAKRGN